MKAIKRTADNVVVYVGPSLTLTGQGASGEGWVDRSTHTGNAVLVDNVTGPAQFAGNAYTLVGSVWALVDQGALDAVLVKPTVPAEVTMRQARQYLRTVGKLAAVNAAVAALPGLQGDLARDEWEYSATVRRNRPIVLQLGAALGLDLDVMFTQAVLL